MFKIFYCLISEITLFLGKYLVLEIATAKSEMKALIGYLEQNIFPA